MFSELAWVQEEDAEPAHPASCHVSLSLLQVRFCTGKLLRTACCWRAEACKAGDSLQPPENALFMNIVLMVVQLVTLCTYASQRITAIRHPPAGST